MESETLHSAHLRAVSLSSLGLSKKAAAAAAEKLTTTTLEGGMRDYVEPPIDEWMLNDVQNIFPPTNLPIGFYISLFVIEVSPNKMKWKTKMTDGYLRT